MNVDKWCYLKGEKQQIVRQDSTTHINKCVDLKNVSTIQIVISGPFHISFHLERNKVGRASCMARAIRRNTF